MFVLHIIVGLEPGGAEKMLQRLIAVDAGSLKRRDTVISLTGMGSIGSQLQQSGVEVFALGLRSPLGVPRVFFQLVRLIRKIQPDIVQTWMYHADFLGGLAARWAGPWPVIWGVRTTDVPAGKLSLTAALRWACARLSHLVPKTIVCAAQASSRSHVAIGYDALKMVVIPNGYDFSWLQASDEQRKTWRSRFGIADDELVVGSLGRLHADKDYATFIQMAGLLAAGHPRARFLLAGRGLDQDNMMLKDWLAASGVASRFILAGERSDVPQCLAAMDVFCLHSKNEGFPNVLAEAMAMGLPCVTTDVGDAAMLIADSGAVTSKEDPVQLAHAVDHLLRMDGPSRNALGQRAKARIESEFSISTARAAYDTVYRRALGEDVNP